VWIVRLALRRPYTFVVLALLLFMIGPLAILHTPTDFFPNINIPVVSIVWSYNGFSGEDMANRITSNYDRALTSDVENIEHIYVAHTKGAQAREGGLQIFRVQ
jgi:multidrug efflux pump subunit AcrB